MNVTVRQASQQDLELLAWAMLKSSRAGKKTGIFDLIFNTDDEALLKKHLADLAGIDVKSYCHYKNFLIAEAANKAIGVLCGYEPRIASMEKFQQALDLLGFDDGFLERIATYMLVLPDMDRQTWMLDFLSVHEDVEPLPVVEALMKKSLLTARLKGYRKAQAMVEIGVTDVQMLYERLGFEVVDNKQSKLYAEQFGRDGIRRLQLSL